MLCLGVGAAIDTSNICLVRAARHLTMGKPAMVIGIVTATAAASVVYYMTTAFNWQHRSWGWSYPTWITVVGAAMFAVGAIANGACAVGTVARIARGDLGHLSTFAGALLVAWLLPRQAMPSHVPDIPLLTGLGWVCIVLAFTAAILLLGRRHLAGSKLWSFIAVGVTAAVVTDWAGNWTWLGVFQHLQAGLRIDPAILVLLGMVFLGVGITAFWKGHFQLLRLNPRVMLREFIGGGLMLGGAILIPGANDTLSVIGVPSGSPDALVGYLVMFAMLMALVRLTNRFTGAPAHPADTRDRYTQA